MLILKIKEIIKRVAYEIQSNPFVLIVLLYWVITHIRLALGEHSWIYLMHEGTEYVARPKDDPNKFWDVLYFVKERFIICSLMFFIYQYSVGYAKRIFLWSFIIAALNFLYQIIKFFPIDFLKIDSYWSSGFGLVLLFLLIFLYKHE